MALNFARDIVLMDDILDNQRMPLAAVLLLEKAGTMAIVLNAHYKRNIDVLEPLIGSLERASKRWTIAGQQTHVDGWFQTNPVGRIVRQLYLMRSQAFCSTSKQS